MLIFLNPPLNVGVSGAELVSLHVCLLWFLPSLMHSFVFSYHPFIDDFKYISVPRPVFWILDLCIQTAYLTQEILTRIHDVPCKSCFALRFPYSVNGPRCSCRSPRARCSYWDLSALLPKCRILYDFVCISVFLIRPPLPDLGGSSLLVCPYPFWHPSKWFVRHHCFKMKSSGFPLLLG